MPIFSIQEKKLLPIKEKDIDLEKSIQKLTEGNLETIFSLQFVRSEFPLNGFRIDTLAFDKEADAFVIIEYKRDRSFSVIDQGFTYLGQMLNNKAEFILEYNEKLNANLTKDEVDWSQSRVLFLAQSFTSYQTNAMSFKDLPIELWEVQAYDNSTILYNQLLSTDAKESIKTISDNPMIKNVSREVKVYILEDHLNATTEKVKNLFYALREKVLTLGDNIEERPKKKYIAYRTRVGFLYLQFQRNQIKIHIIVNKSKLNDPKGIARDVSNIGHYGGGETELILAEIEDLPYIMTIIEQSYHTAE